MNLQGRNDEKSELQLLMQDPKPHLVAVIGRRRVGKTYLIRQYFKNEIVFEFVGLFQEGLKVHMQRFAKSLSHYFYGDVNIAAPKNWYDAFDELEKGYSKIRSRKKKVIFLDELPWMGSSNSRFKKAFSSFWNSWGSKQDDLILIISGSSTSWMYSEIFNDKGGLYHRVTKRLYLQPFTLFETERYLKSKGINLTRLGLLELYLIFGGIPFYIDMLNPGESVTQAVNRLLFKKNALLRSEFDELFKSLFGESEIHKKIALLLSQQFGGVTRNNIILKLKLKSGGDISKILEELEKCGFITGFVPFGNKAKDKKYKLTDPFTLFYLKFVNNKSSTENWDKISKTPAWASWSGLAFENTCLQHIKQMRKALKIEGIQSDVSYWHKTGTAEMSGAQIDIMIDRADGVINICDAKYHKTMLVPTKELADSFRKKMDTFQFYSKTKKALFPTIIAPFGIHHNNHSQGFIQNVITLDDLFEP